MPAYRIEQYELHTTTYEVEAANEAEAIAKVFDGIAQALNNSSQYVEVAEAYGMSTNNLNHETLKRLSELGYPCKEYVDSIRSIEEVTDE